MTPDQQPNPLRSREPEYMPAHDVKTRWTWANEAGGGSATWEPVAFFRRHGDEPPLPATVDDHLRVVMSGRDVPGTPVITAMEYDPELDPASLRPVDGHQIPAQNWWIRRAWLKLPEGTRSYEPWLPVRYFVVLSDDDSGWRVGCTVAATKPSDHDLPQWETIHMESIVYPDSSSWPVLRYSADRPPQV